MKIILLSFVIMLTASSILAYPSTWQPRNLPEKQSYPKIYDRADDTKKDLCISSSFKTRNAVFLNELADSMRVLKHSIADTLGNKYAVLQLFVDSVGQVDSVSIMEQDSSFSRCRDTVLHRISTWQFNATLGMESIILQDLVTEKAYSKNFFKRHPKLVWLGLLFMGLFMFL